MRIKIIFLLMLGLFWVMIMGIPLGAQAIYSAIAAIAVTYFLSKKFNIIPQNIFLKVNAVSYIFWLFKEILFSAISVSKIAWRKRIVIIPTIEPIVTIQNKELGKVIYANSITLTPGTVTLSMDGEHLLIHALDHSFMDDLKEGTMDRRVNNIIKN